MRAACANVLVFTCLDPCVRPSALFDLFFFSPTGIAAHRNRFYFVSSIHPRSFLLSSFSFFILRLLLRIRTLRSVLQLDEKWINYQPKSRATIFFNPPKIDCFRFTRLTNLDSQRAPEKEVCEEKKAVYLEANDGSRFTAQLDFFFHLFYFLRWNCQPFLTIQNNQTYKFYLEKKKKKKFARVCDLESGCKL